MKLSSSYSLSDHPRITKLSWLDNQKKKLLVNQVGQNVLIIYSPFMARLGWLNDWLEVFTQKQIKPEMYLLAGEPTWEDLQNCQTKIKSNTRILGFGGGSVMDLSKVAATSIVECATKMDFIKPKKLTTKNRLWLFPTHYSSSSYVSSSATLIKAQQKISGVGLSVEKIFVDPQVLETIPHRSWIDGIVDTTSHFIEIFCSTSSSEALRFMALQGWWRDFIRALETRDFESLFSLAAYLYDGLFRLSSVSWPIHHLAHDLGPKLKMGHGHILKLLLPIFLEARLNNHFYDEHNSLLKEINLWLSSKYEVGFSNDDYTAIWISELWNLEGWYDPQESFKISFKEYLMSAQKRLLL